MIDAAGGIILILILGPIIAIFGEDIVRSLWNTFRKMNGH
jgi:hypothetical protein